jgi:hypothetical protein
MDKENTPSKTTIGINKSARRNKVFTLTQRGRWTSEAFKSGCQTSLKKVKKIWHI